MGAESKWKHGDVMARVGGERGGGRGGGVGDEALEVHGVQYDGETAYRPVPWVAVIGLALGDGLDEVGGGELDDGVEVGALISDCPAGDSRVPSAAAKDAGSRACLDGFPVFPEVHGGWEVGRRWWVGWGRLQGEEGCESGVVWKTWMGGWGLIMAVGRGKLVRGVR